MQISLNKRTEVPLHEQLAEQIVFLITTGKLHAAEQMPSVRALGRQLGIHHNTVSKSYRDLVSRGWLKGQRGGRLYVGTAPPPLKTDLDLDELINHTIWRANELGYSLQSLRSKVWERLCAQPPDHILVVEPESELRAIMCSEISSRVSKPIKTCSTEEFLKSPELCFGAQVVAPDHAVHAISPHLPLDRPCIGLTFAEVDGHLALIRRLAEPSVIGVVSISKTFLRTARSLLAPVIGRRHSLREFLLPLENKGRLDGIDLAFCDSTAMPLVRSRRKIHYRLLANRTLDDLAVAMVPAVAPKR